MKKIFSVVLAVALLITALVIPASALETVEEGPFTITNVYGKTYFEDETLQYVCAENPTITINKDCKYISIYCYNYLTGAWDTLGLTYTYQGEPMFDSTKFIITHSKSGVSYSFRDFVDCLIAGTIDDTDDVDTPAGASFTVLATMDYSLIAHYADGTYESCYFSVNPAEELAEIDVESLNGDETEEVEDVAVEESGLIASGNMVYMVVDGVAMELAAYNIADNNYFKLRDIAALISGSEKQFEVTWNGDEEMIEMTSGLEYTIVGGENEATEISDAEAGASNAGLLKDGESASATAYEIADNNYFKLRDLGEMFDFNVTWDADTESIIIDTTNSYIVD